VAEAETKRDEAAGAAAALRRPPRIFISYSHDSEEHSARVLELATRLRSEGVDAWLDRYEPAPPVPPGTPPRQAPATRPRALRVLVRRALRRPGRGCANDR
jgi:hypothetical protein